MISRDAKAAFYAICGPLLWLNGYLYRAWRAPRSGVAKVQLGPGQKNYFEGWINVDANMFTARCDVWADLRRKLPFRDGTLDVIYSHHVIEHLPDSLLGFHFAEIHRCLKPGGVFRVAGPNGDMAMRKYAQGDIAWFASDFPDKRDSLGGRLTNFLLCRGEHLTILTFSYMEELALKAGFKSIRACHPRTETRYPELIDRVALDTEWVEEPAAPHTLVVEGRKE